MNHELLNANKLLPDSKGFFGRFGGSFVQPELQAQMDEIAHAYHTICRSHNFVQDLRNIRKHFQGRPTPVYYCKNLTEKVGGARIYLKREDLNHTGAHKLNHCMGEALLAKYLGKKKLIAETGAGQHGVALATAGAYFGIPVEIHMGEVDIKKEYPNVMRMKVLGAKVVSVTRGDKTLKEAVDSAFESYLDDPVNSIYCIGSVLGPHPFPLLVREFQRVIGIEAREQFFEMTGEMPDNICACIGGGSNAAGFFHAFVNDPVEIYGVEPLGRGTKLGDHACSLAYGTEGIMHGFNSIMLKDEKGDPAPVYSVASGLDYPSVGPEHAYWHEIGREKAVQINDDEAITAFFRLSRLEGIIPALESAHAVAFATKLAVERPTESILVNLSGRGDKDLDFVMENFGEYADREY